MCKQISSNLSKIEIIYKLFTYKQYVYTYIWMSANKWLMLNWYYYIAILQTLCKQMINS